MATDAESRCAIEVGLVGNEGVIGIPAFLGAKKSPTLVIWQVAGECLKMPALDFITATDNGIRLRAVLTRYAQALHNQTTQLVLCNNAHAIEERLCRWLLMTHDRMGRDELPLTQGFLSQMLGTRRPSVTVAAGMLERAGLIEHRRGHVRIINRAGLEDGACECYGVAPQLRGAALALNRFQRTDAAAWKFVRWRRAGGPHRSGKLT